MKRVGLDIGAYSIKLVIEENSQILLKVEYKENQIEELLNVIPDDTFLFCSLNLSDDSYDITESEALMTGAKYIYPESNSLMMIGSQTSRYLTYEPLKLYSNSNCSSGTGSFIEEQALKLGVSLSEFGKMAASAEKEIKIAGRCSVFSKTDMIHHMQEGENINNILSGLCHAVVRNFKSNVLKKHELKLPLCLAGGVMQNEGIRIAIRDLIGDALYDENAPFISAIGCMLNAKNEITKEKLKSLFEKRNTLKNSETREPLRKYLKDTDFKRYEAKKTEDKEGYLGVDVGSTSINLVLINKNREIIYQSYVKNKGVPYQIILSEIDKMKSELSPDFQILGIMTTGSGREYIGKKINATKTVNEITAQAKGNIENCPDTDTIFEIGGQDSKYVSLENGMVRDFEMNKVCAAGTGSFLEEQIYKMNITMAEFLDLAMKSEHPAALGDRCTVFIEASIARELKNSRSLEDVCAGLAYAIVNNYLNRVVNNKKIGNKIRIQGGIAYNTAVVCAFRSILNNPEIEITPYFDVTGAYGAALLLMDTRDTDIYRAEYRAWDKKILEESERTFLNGYVPKAPSKKERIGIPRVLFLHKMFPLFKIMFEHLGYEVVLSDKSSKETVAKAQEYVMEETCFPVKLIYGHIANLIEQKVDYIFLPRLYTIKHDGAMARKNYSCAYMHTTPLMMNMVFDFDKLGIKLLMPEFNLQYGKRQMASSVLSLSDTLHVKKRSMIFGALKAVRYFNFRDKYLEKMSREALKGTTPTFVLITRAYNLEDPVLNMGIESHLMKLGVKFIRLENLDAEYMNTNDYYWDMCWPFGQHMLTGIGVLKKYPHLFPIYITNHGCGPDTAIQHYVHHELNDRPFLHLEVDEHSSPVGVETRLEAFINTVINFKGYEVKKEERKEATALSGYISEMGIYTPLLKTGEKDIVSSGIGTHSYISYAYNKESFSLLYMYEEAIKNLKKDTAYLYYYPKSEGNDPSHLYGKLISQDLNDKGYHINPFGFYIEDIIKKKNYLDIFKRMIELEVSHIDFNKKNLILTGEPFVIYREKLIQYVTSNYDFSDYNLVPMPLSEALCEYYKEIYKGKYKKEISQIEALIKNASDKLGEHSVYSEKLECSNKNFKFLAGNFAHYRMAKLEDMSKKFKCLNFYSAEENEEIVLKNIRKELNNNVFDASIDFEHLVDIRQLKTFLKR